MLGISLYSQCLVVLLKGSDLLLCFFKLLLENVDRALHPLNILVHLHEKFVSLWKKMERKCILFSSDIIRVKTNV